MPGSTTCRHTCPPVGLPVVLRWLPWAAFMLTSLLPVWSATSAQEPIRLDVKTRLGDKADLSPTHIGAAAHLATVGWVETVEFGEDFSVWLLDYRKVLRGDTTVVALGVELRTPAFIRSGSTLAVAEVAVPFRAHSLWAGVNSIRDAIERQLRNSKQEIRAEAALVGGRVADVVVVMLLKLGVAPEWAKPHRPLPAQSTSPCGTRSRRSATGGERCR